MAVVRLPSILRAHAGGLADVEVEASSISSALEAVAAAHPALRARLFTPSGALSSHVLVFHGGRLVKPEAIGEVEFDPQDRIDLLVPTSGGGGDDVRMKGFRHRVTVEEAVAAALDGIAPLPAESVPVTDSPGRILAHPVSSTVDVPPFRRSAMDGYAVVAEDTFGATAYDPVILPVIGTSMPGVGAPVALQPGMAIRIMTGAPVPEGADAVLRAEDGNPRGDDVEVRASVAAGRNVGRVGEDIAAGTVVLGAGRRLLPADVGLLASIGATPVAVHRRPNVLIVVSGDELLPPGATPSGHRIVDSNSVMLAALVERDGGIPMVKRVKDDEAELRGVLEAPGADVIVTSGAASVGTEDRVPLLVRALGELTVHGVAMRPSAPSGVGTIGGSRVLLLPGNPVSTLVAYDFFAGPVIRRLGGRSTAWPYRAVTLPLAERLVSQVGRTDYARVTIRDGSVHPVAISGASVLSSVTRADGFVVVPSPLEGYPAGVAVSVGLYSSEEQEWNNASS